MARPVRTPPAFARVVERRRVRLTVGQSKETPLQSQAQHPRLHFAR
jgi:hypothetical protein